MERELEYSVEPENKKEFTERWNQTYAKYARVYDLTVKISPFWKRWLKTAIPYIIGPRVLEISFGTGYLLTQYANRFETYGIDVNERMLSIAERNLSRAGITARLQHGNVESLPYESEFFDSVVNTMSFSGYPDGLRAMSEMHRVLKKGARLTMVDVAYPMNKNWLGVKLTKCWGRSGDIIRDMADMFSRFGFEFTDTEIGGLGSVHLYVAEKT